MLKALISDVKNSPWESRTLMWTLEMCLEVMLPFASCCNLCLELSPTTRANLRSLYPSDHSTKCAWSWRKCHCIWAYVSGHLSFLPFFCLSPQGRRLDCKLWSMNLPCWLIFCKIYVCWWGLWYINSYSSLSESVELLSCVKLLALLNKTILKQR